MNRADVSAQQSDMSDERRGGAWTEGGSFGDWWKLVVAGPLIVIAVIVGAGLGVDAWFIGFAAVIFAVLLTALGLVLGFVRLLTRRSSAGT